LVLYVDADAGVLPKRAKERRPHWYQELLGSKQNAAIGALSVKPPRRPATWQQCRQPGFSCEHLRIDTLWYVVLRNVSAEVDLPKERK